MVLVTNHQAPEVKKWLAARPRYHVHYTPTDSSGLNQVEIWFNIITQKAIRRGAFSSVKKLSERIDHIVKAYNINASPLAWTATADSILEKLSRLSKVIHGTEHELRSQYSSG